MSFSENRFSRFCLVLSAFTLGIGVAGQNAKAQNTERKKCSSDFFSQSCTDDSKKPLDLRKDRTEADGIVFNYFLLGKRDHVDEIRRLNSEPSSELRKRSLDLAEEVRKIAIQNASAGLSDADFTPEISAIVMRLRTVKIEIAPSHSSTCFEQGDTGIPNAGYSPIEHTIHICPSMTKTSSQEIAQTMAHELAHVVSPCAMSKELLRFNSADNALGSCLMGIGDGDSRTEEDREIWGDGPISVAEFPDEGYALNMEPEKNQAFIRCGAATAIAGSQLQNPVAYQSFNRCAASLYKTAHEDAIAFELFRLDKKPNFSALPRPKGAQWEHEFNQRLANESSICFRKREEHFADSLGGQWFASWSKSKDLGAKHYLAGLHGLSHPYCAEKISQNFKMSPHQYPSSAERLEILMKPRYTAELLGCDPVKSETLCALPEDAFDRAVAEKTKLRETKPRGTKP